MESLAPRPLRYVGMAFKASGVWWRQGKRIAYLIADELDTSRLYQGTQHPLCGACDVSVDHSSRHHRLSVMEGRRKAICTPDRAHLIVTP